MFPMYNLTQVNVNIILNFTNLMVYIYIRSHYLVTTHFDYIMM